MIEDGTYTTEEIIDTNKNVKSQYILGQHNGKDVILRKGKFGPYVYYKTDDMKKPNFFNIKKFPKNIAINLVFGLKLIDADLGDD